MADRALATIRKVFEVRKHPNADKLDILTIDGWQCISNRGEFNAGDDCVYIEIDSILPPIKYFDFMSDRKYRVKTIRLRGELSQGLVIPLVDAVEIAAQLGRNGKIKGEDLTEYLGITKYIKPSEREVYCIPKGNTKHNWFIRYMTRFQWFGVLFKKKSKSFPSFIPKTDEVRIQNSVKYLNDTEDKYYITEKLDGYSATYVLNNKKFYVCSRTVLRFEKDNSVWSVIARELDIKNKLKSVHKNIAIQGEIIGGKIQGNRLARGGYELYLFNVYDVDKKQYYNYHEFIKFCASYGFKHVPVIADRVSLPKTVSDAISMADGNSVINKDKMREGLVFRHMFQKTHNRVSFKAISNNYLLKESD